LELTLVNRNRARAKGVATGVLEVLTPDMSDEEMRSLEHSATTLREALAKYGTR
jgi:hypothetical protein